MSRAEEKALGRGFLAGIFWGAIVSVAILLVSNFSLDRQQLSFPRPEAVPVEVPAGSEFDQARPESDPVVPETETRPASEAVAGVTPPADIVDAPPSFDTSSLEVPQPTIEGPGGLGDVPEVAEGVEIDVTGPGPTDRAQPPVNPELAAPEAPTTAPDTFTEAPTPAVAPKADAGEGPLDEVIALVPEREEVTPELSLGEPGTGDATRDEGISPGATDSAIAPGISEAPEVMTSPQVLELPGDQQIGSGDGGTDSFFRPVEEITDLAPEVETDRLPRIGNDAGDAIARAPEVAEVTPVDPKSPQPSDDLPTIRRGIESEPLEATEESDELSPVSTGPAIDVWRQAFEPKSNDPLFSIVLVHQGETTPEQTALSGLSKTVAFAVDAGLTNAANIAAAYRADGREVVMIPSLPLGATPQDVEVALRVNFETVAEAVAVMDATGDAFQSDRDAVAQLVDVLVDTGHGMITFPRGLNTAHQRAQRRSVPAGLIFRDIDGEGQSSEQILRGMDRAAFRARTDRPVILVGRGISDTFEAVQEWTQGSRAESIELAPVSAALSVN